MSDVRPLFHPLTHPRCNLHSPHSATLEGRSIVCSTTENYAEQAPSQRMWCGEACNEDRILQEPSACDRVLDKGSLNDLTKKLIGVKRWFDMGLLLGLNCSTLVEIISEHWDDISSCRRDMISCWLKSHDRVSENGGPTVKSLVTALRCPLVDCSDIADQVNQKFSSAVAGNSKVPTSNSGTPHKSLMAIKLDEKPMLPKLLQFEGREKIINIVREIGTKYTTLGILLLQDDSGARVDALENRYQRDADRINLSILRDWLDGQGLQPVTWGTLVKALKSVGLDTLAEDIIKM